MSRTIARNATTQIAEIRNSAVWCKYYSEDVGEMRECDPVHAWDRLNSQASARLIFDKPGQYTIRVHSALWYTLTVPANPPYQGGETVRGLFNGGARGTCLGEGKVTACVPDSWRWPNHWRVTVDLADEGERTYHAVNSKGESDYLSRGGFEEGKS